MRLKILSIPVLLVLVLTSCGGGGDKITRAETFDLEAGYASLAHNGDTTSVSLSGTIVMNGTSTPFAGSGTLAINPASTTTFNGLTALSQLVTIDGTVTASGQSASYASSVTDYYGIGTTTLLGETSSNEYDVAPTPLAYPAMVEGGSNGLLGTLNRYTDGTMGVSLGTAQVSYQTMTPVDPGSPMPVLVTVKIYDTQDTLIETDVTTYSLTSANDMAFVAATAENASGTLTVSRN